MLSKNEGGEKITKKENKKYPTFAVRVESVSLQEDWNIFCKAKREKNKTKSGNELKNAIHEYMEREGWDFENRKFIDFNDKDEDNSLNKTRHTHIDQDEKSTDPAEIQQHEIGKSHGKSVNHENSNNPAGAIASTDISEQTPFINVKTPSNDEIFTYAFCKLYEKFPEVHYEEIEQLIIPIFNIKEDRAIRNKPNILIANQCAVRKLSNKKMYKTLPDGIQQFKAKNQYIEQFLLEKVNKDFWNELTP